jgi:hypothetical protein
MKFWSVQEPAFVMFSDLFFWVLNDEKILKNHKTPPLPSLPPPNRKGEKNSASLFGGLLFRVEEEL